MNVYGMVYLYLEGLMGFCRYTNFAILCYDETEVIYFYTEIFLNQSFYCIVLYCIVLCPQQHCTKDAENVYALLVIVSV
jgi:hypothetical protein